MMKFTVIDIFSGLLATPAAAGPILGKAAFIGVFVILLVWLLLMPRTLIGHGDGPVPWWRNTRVWAVVVTVAQILVYLRWG